MAEPPLPLIFSKKIQPPPPKEEKNSKFQPPPMKASVYTSKYEYIFLRISPLRSWSEDGEYMPDLPINLGLKIKA